MAKFHSLLSLLLSAHELLPFIHSPRFLLLYFTVSAVQYTQRYHSFCSHASLIIIRRRTWIIRSNQAHIHHPYVKTSSHISKPLPCSKAFACIMCLTEAKWHTSCQAILSSCFRTHASHEITKDWYPSRCWRPILLFTWLLLCLLCFIMSSVLIERGKNMSGWGRSYLTSRHVCFVALSIICRCQNNDIWFGHHLSERWLDWFTPASISFQSYHHGWTLENCHQEESQWFTALDSLQ